MMRQVAGNDPNVGRLVSAVGSYLGRAAPELPLDACTMQMGGRTIFAEGAFAIECASSMLHICYILTPHRAASSPHLLGGLG